MSLCDSFNNPTMSLHAVQHLIENCLLFYMDREECVACLQKHAGLKPAITRIVWDELEKSNVDFFAAYTPRRMELQLAAEAQHVRNMTTASPTSTLVTMCRAVNEDKENQQNVQ